MELQDTRNEYFMRLYEPHHASALAYGHRLTGNEDDARDLLQDSLEAALRGFGKLRHADSFKPWFFRVMRNNHLNRVRRAKLANRFAFEVDPDMGPRIDDETAERVKLFGALSELSPEEKEAVLLFEVEGFSLREIAGIQRRSVATIKYRLRQGRRKLVNAYFSDTPPPSARIIPARDDRGG